MALNTVKGNTRVPFIPGTKPSIKNAQLLVSTGIPSLDHIIGGGLPIGSLFIIEEDTYGTYAKVMSKYFMAEGVITEQPLLVASQDVKPSQLISEIPSAVIDATPMNQSQHIDEQMKIAWRYQNMKMVDTSPTGGQLFGHFYDLTKPMEKETMEKANIIQWHDENWHTSDHLFTNMAYMNLLKKIQETLNKGQYSISETPAKRQVLRVAICSLGSRQWLSDSEHSSHHDLLKFIYYLRTLLRNSYAVALITIPADNFDKSGAIVERIEHMSDIAIRLESFAGSAKETNPLFKDYHGLLHVKKLPALNTLAPHNPESRDLVFKLRRKKFVIEVLHLPPELGDTAQREQDEIIPQTGGCMTNTRKSVLDF